MAQSWQDIVRYEELLIELREAGGEKPRYSIRLSLDDQGVEQGEFRLPLSLREIEQVLTTASRKQWVQRATSSDSLDPLRDMGAQLFSALFYDQRGIFYQKALDRMERQGKGLRLRVVAGSPQLAAMPWEFLYDVYRQDFLSLSARSPVVRQLESTPASASPAPIAPPLSVLVVAADITADRQRGVEQEIDLLRKLGEETGLLRLDVKGATPHKLAKALQKKPYDILHFIGAGIPLESGAGPLDLGAQALAFLNGDDDEPDDDRPYVLDGRELAAILQDAGTLRLAYLSGRQTDRLAGQISRQVPAALGMRGMISVPACLNFTEGFYRALLTRQPLEGAVSQGRQQIDTRDPGGREWGLPTFYMRLADGAMLPQLKETAELSALAQSSASATLSIESDSTRQQREKLQLHLAILKRNLDILSQQSARYGTDTPSHIAIQIDESQRTIKGIEAELKKLGS